MRGSIIVGRRFRYDSPVTGRELRTFHCQHGARGAAQDGFRHTSVHEMGQSTATVRAHYDKVALIVLNEMDERITGQSSSDRMISGDPF
jgi:hypothetical protein